VPIFNSSTLLNVSLLRSPNDCNATELAINRDGRMELKGSCESRENQESKEQSERTSNSSQQTICNSDPNSQECNQLKNVVKPH